jgi:hypothetical protein
MKYPHLFCSLHNQAGNVLNLASMGGQHDGDGRGIAPGWDGTLWKYALFGPVFNCFLFACASSACHAQTKQAMYTLIRTNNAFQRVSRWVSWSGQVAI